MWDRFDYIAVCCYTGYVDRVEELKPELKRVGLLDKVHFHWDFPSIFRDRLFETVGKSKYCSKGGCFYMLMAHYNVIKLAYELGKQNILVMEDDVRFLKDVSRIEEMLSSLPDDYEMAMLDRSKPSEMPLDEFVQDTRSTEVANGWHRFQKATSTGCYAMSREAMRHYLEIIEREVAKDRVRNPDYYFRDEALGIRYWEPDAKRYFAYPSIAVQVVCGKSGSHCSMKEYWERNEACGIKQSDYAIAAPITTKSSFLEQLYDRMDGQVEPLDFQKMLSSRLFNPQKGKPLDSILPWRNTQRSMANGEADYTFVWGNGENQPNFEAVQEANRDGSTIVLCEDGFIRSYDTWVSKTAPVKARESYSMIIDTLGYYFDATRETTIERMLNDRNLVVSAEELAKARELIDRIVKNKVSKYNHQPISAIDVGRQGRRKVLVVDQSYGDFSIKKGMADDGTFEKMLNVAISENPDADVLVKTHPDTIAGRKGKKQGYYQDLVEHDNIYKVTFPINPYSLMEICDKVYVCSSQFGLEALMAGKEVHTFGMPFYAGWGLTIDDLKCERRTNRRSLEELFYIFYCKYTLWVNPARRALATIDFVIDRMISLREEMKYETAAKRRRIVSAPVGFGKPPKTTTESAATEDKQKDVLPKERCVQKKVRFANMVSNIPSSGLFNCTRIRS